MKARHAITLLVLGYCVDFVGALQKILHSPNADLILTAGMALKVAGGLLLLYKLLRYGPLRDFMDR